VPALPCRAGADRTALFDRRHLRPLFARRLSSKKIVCLEEHIATPAIIAAWQALDPATRDLAIDLSTGNDKERRLLDTGELRIASMDEAGIDVAVLSHTTPGVQCLRPLQAVPLARKANDLVAEAVTRRPDRFQGLATLPMSAPDEAARELERAAGQLGLNGAMVFGRTGDRNLDHRDFMPILEAAAALRAPLYIHPQTPQFGVRDAYYGGPGDQLEVSFATSGLGWHFESGIQALRLILSGVIERLPDLQLILGHWGEVILFYLERIDLNTDAARLPRPISDYFRTNVSVTSSGILSDRYLRWATEVIGADRILCATDYPFPPIQPNGNRDFLQASSLNEADQEKIGSGNWGRLCADIRR
jgi:predicted TIM-barrel fold metal-dependent hydrolase